MTAPLPGSPAERIGLKPGDVVTLVDGTSVDGLTVDAARDRIRGPKGSAVALTIDRGDGVPLLLSITRDIVQSQEVESRALADGTIGYIKIAGFSDASADQVVAALTAHLAAGRERLVIDLRGDPGGYVTAARKIASQFIGSGVVFWQQDAKGNQVPTEALTDGVATDPHVKVVVLIDGGSASASEIVAGALQDSKRAVLVGRHSYGKGTDPAVAGADRRGRGVQADRRPLADAGQALDQRHRPDPGRRGDPAGDRPGRHGPGPGPGARDPRRPGSRRRPATGGLTLAAGRAPHGSLLRSPRASGTVSGNERR